MMHCYEIIPSWKAWLCFNPWLRGAALFDSPQGGTSPCPGPARYAQTAALLRSLDSGFPTLVNKGALHIISTPCVLHRHALASKALPEFWK